MSYTNSIGNLQQIVSSIAAGEVKGSQQTKPAQGPTGAPENSISSTSSRSDQASLSVASNVIAQALSSDDVRVEKVAALQQAIASGTYNVSSSNIADKLIESLLK